MYCAKIVVLKYSNVAFQCTDTDLRKYTNSGIITHLEQNCRSQTLKRKSKKAKKQSKKKKKRRPSYVSSTPVRSRPKNHLNLHVHPFHPQNIHFRVVVHFPREKTESRTTFNLSISLQELHLSTVVS